MAQQRQIVRCASGARDGGKKGQHRGTSNVGVAIDDVQCTVGVETRHQFWVLAAVARVVVPGNCVANRFANYELVVVHDTTLRGGNPLPHR